jgi:hypothetical protein
MGIDGINKPGGGLPPGAIEPSAVGSADFKDKLGVEGKQAPQDVGSDALQRFDAGELTVDEYLDLQVDQAVAHLEGKLPAEQLDFVRASLRTQLTEDPVLAELVRRTTGGAR